MRRPGSRKRARPTQRSRRPSLARRWAGRVLVALTLVLAFLLLFVLLLRWVNPPYSMYMLSDASGPLGSSLYRHWQPIDALPPHVLLAVIAAEDQRFPLHRGFDWHSIRQAVDAHRRGERLRGASTITQQTAKNLFLWHGRSLFRKSLEAGFTLAIETLWPKHRILEVYLNIAEWGPGIFGVEAASRSHFGIPARQLNREQAALLAAVLPNPLGYSPTRPSETVHRRARWIEQQMVQLGEGWLDPLGLPARNEPGWSGRPASR